METKGSPETSVPNQLTPHSNPEEGRKNLYQPRQELKVIQEKFILALVVVVVVVDNF
jgi:hypothetical protein